MLPSFLSDLCLALEAGRLLSFVAALSGKGSTKPTSKIVQQNEGVISNFGAKNMGNNIGKIMYQKLPYNMVSFATW